MKLAAIWRYPIKSMAGERLVRTHLTSAGIAGDRIVQVYDRHGSLVTARRFPKPLALHATLSDGGEPLVEGVPWHSPETTARVEAAVGPGAHLAKFEGPERFDILPLLVCTETTLSTFGRDPRRLRPNVVLAGGATHDHHLEGARLQLPGAEITVVDLRERCVMTTFDPDTISQDPSVLRDIVRRFAGRLCLNASVSRPGDIAVDDVVEVVRR